jgi:hypothetical protein
VSEGERSFGDAVAAAERSLRERRGAERLARLRAATHET